LGEDTPGGIVVPIVRAEERDGGGRVERDQPGASPLQQVLTQSVPDDLGHGPAGPPRGLLDRRTEVRVEADRRPLLDRRRAARRPWMSV
jgi:hypothetical protein